VIQPHIPVRLPCDNLTPLIEPGFVNIKNVASPRPNSADLMGGVCKEQGRIHRGLLNLDY